MISPMFTVPVVMPVSGWPFAAFGWVGVHWPWGCETTPVLGVVGWDPVVGAPVFGPPVPDVVGVEPDEGPLPVFPPPWSFPRAAAEPGVVVGADEAEDCGETRAAGG